MTARRIAIAGFQHETNTFAPARASLEDFRIADSWPALLEGDDVLTGTSGLNLPIAGAAAHAAATKGLADDVEPDINQAPDVSFTPEQLREFYRKYIPQQVHIQLLVFRSSTEYKFF